MPREVDLSLNEQTFILDSLREHCRLDGRGLDAYRELELTFGDEYGVVNASLGNTRVVCRISAQVTAPYPDRPFDGLFTVSIELSPMASPSFEAGRSAIIETLLSRFLDKTIRRSSAIDVESLCLVVGSKCFHVRADIHVLAHDGNILDVSCVALNAALQHFRRPDVTVDGENIIVWNIREREPIKLNLFHHPLCVSFSYYDRGDIAVIDSTSAEEKVREGEVVISMNKFGEVCQMAKHGGETVDALTLLGWSRIAFERVKAIDKYIQTKLSEDATRRDVSDFIAELSAANDR